MEMTKIEVATVTDVATRADELSVIDLVDLQLASIGGGVGEVVLA